jgi:hypothetical protein
MKKHFESYSLSFLMLILMLISKENIRKKFLDYVEFTQVHLQEYKKKEDFQLCFRFFLDQMKNFGI